MTVLEAFSLCLYPSVVSISHIRITLLLIWNHQSYTETAINKTVQKQ